MKKRIIFVLLAVLSVSFASTGFAAKKAAPKADTKKSAPVVLAKGLHISWCGNEVKDNGSVTIPGLKDVTIPVKKGKFDLTVPSNPVFDEEEVSRLQSGFEELAFGSVKVYSFRIIYFNNSNTTKSREETANGRGGISLKVYYSEKDVKGTVDGKPVSLKKGWNIIGDKTKLEASLMCAG